MPLHSLQLLPGGALMGRWHLTEAPAALWPLLAEATAYASLLPAAGLARHAQWLAGRVLVQHLLRAAAPGRPLPQLLSEASGRPYLAGPEPVPMVSLSHAGEWVVALLAPPSQAVGIDIETVRDKAQRIKGKFLNSSELAAAEQQAGSGYFAAHPAARYSLLWSAKETLYKLGGRTGIIFRENLLLDLPAGPWPRAGQLPARLLLAGVETRHHICYTEPAPGYVLTYCVG